MRYVVVGCGRLGSDLAMRLFEKGHDVAVIDSIPASFTNLPANFQGRFVEGEALSEDVLHRAGIAQADGVAAVTNLDALNAVVAHLAREVYHVKSVVVRNYDPRCRPMHEAFNLQVISSTSWGSQRLEEMLYQMEMRTVFSAGNGEVEVYEFTVPESWDGKLLSALINSDQAVPVSVSRAGRALMPRQDTVLSEGDLVNFSATLEGVEYLRAQLDQA